MERLFSLSKATISDRRTKLDAEKVNKLLFLQKNLSVLKKLDNVTTDELTNLQQKRKITETSSTTMPFQAEQETFATREKKLKYLNKTKLFCLIMMKILQIKKLMNLSVFKSCFYLNKYNLNMILCKKVSFGFLSVCAHFEKHIFSINMKYL